MQNKEITCLCAERASRGIPGPCAPCVKRVAAYPDDLVYRAAELGIEVNKCATLEDLERAIIAAENERDAGAQ